MPQATDSQMMKPKFLKTEAEYNTACIRPANLVNPVIDTLPLTVRAASSSLSSLRSDSVKKCFMNRNSNAQ